MEPVEFGNVRRPARKVLRASCQIKSALKIQNVHIILIVLLEKIATRAGSAPMLRLPEVAIKTAIAQLENTAKSLMPWRRDLVTQLFPRLSQ